jgi:histidinol-phosphate aminotransferase
VVLDEAYQEYVQSFDYPDGIELVKKGYPVIVLRTFLKHMA